MKITITGGSGFIGSRLIEMLLSQKHFIVLLTRSGVSSMEKHPGVTVRQWDGKTVGEWANDVDGSDAIINLAGEPIAAKRWTSTQKEKILNSRLDATRAIVSAIKQTQNKPSVLINGSAVGYYGSVESGEVFESRGRGQGFLADVCESWEHEARAAETFGVRVVMLRIGIVLGEGGGALQKMILPFKLFVGGPIGTGKQWFPWVHRDDVVSIAMVALQQKSLSGPINVAAPDSATMRGFCASLGKAMRRPSWVPVPGFVISMVLGEMAEMLLTGQQVVPTKLNANGYRFLFPKLDDALTNIFA